MKTLKEHINTYKDITKKHETISFRFYSKEAQTTLITLIIEEFRKNDIQAIPELLFFKLASPDQLATENIYELCDLYKQVILFCRVQK